MSSKIRVGIAGYGNLGRGVELALAQNPDMELVSVFTRRDPASLRLQSAGVPVRALDQIEQATLERDYGIAADFRETTTVCIERPAQVAPEQPQDGDRQVRPPRLGDHGPRLGIGPHDHAAVRQRAERRHLHALDALQRVEVLLPEGALAGHADLHLLLLLFSRMMWPTAVFEAGTV